MVKKSLLLKYFTENQEKAANAIVVADRCNRNTYQYLLDDKKWVKIINNNRFKRFPESVGEICGIHEIDNVFYVVGNKGILTLNNELYKFPSNEDHWWSTSLRVEKNILVIQSNHGDHIESKLFDTTSKQWSDINIRAIGIKFSVVEYLNQVWIVGGEKNSDGGHNNILNTVQIYDPVLKTTSLSPVKMIKGRVGHKVIVYENNFFVFGGHGKNHYEFLNTVEMYSFEKNKFVMMAPMKTGRSRFACCRVGNLVYVIGGLTSLGKTNSVEVYNLDTDTWTDGENFPACLFDVHACAVNNKLE